MKLLSVLCTWGSCASSARVLISTYLPLKGVKKGNNKRYYYALHFRYSNRSRRCTTSTGTLTRRSSLVTQNGQCCFASLVYIGRSFLQHSQHHNNTLSPERRAPPRQLYWHQWAGRMVKLSQARQCYSGVASVAETNPSMSIATSGSPGVIRRKQLRYGSIVSTTAYPSSRRLKQYPKVERSEFKRDLKSLAQTGNSEVKTFTDRLSTIPRVRPRELSPRGLATSAFWFCEHGCNPT